MNPLINFDQLIYQQLLLIQQDWLTPIMVFITDFLSPITLPIFALLLVAWFVYKKQTAKAVLTVLSLGGGFILEVGLKMIIARPRPPLNLVPETGYSFPSGHAVLSIIFFSLLIYFFKDNFKSKFTRRLYIFVNVLLCALVGFSRLYLGVHWLSDVIGGFVIGFAWFLFLVILFRKTLDNESTAKLVK